MGIEPTAVRAVNEQRRRVSHPSAVAVGSISTGVLVPQNVAYPSGKASMNSAAFAVLAAATTSSGGSGYATATCSEGGEARVESADRL